MPRLLTRIWITLLLLVPLILWILPGDAFDHHPEIVLCPSKLFFDVECLGCGMTRAVMHAHHFQWPEALYYNYGVMAIYPALIAAWGFLTYQAWKSLRHPAAAPGTDPTYPA